MTWKDIFDPTTREQGDWQGALSTLAEWHALAIGLGIGVVAAAVARPELMTAVALIAVGEAEAQGNQLKDVSKEPAYAIAGLAIGYLVVGFVLNPLAIERLNRLLDGIGNGKLVAA